MIFKVFVSVFVFVFAAALSGCSKNSNDLRPSPCAGYQYNDPKAGF